jgi:hypothetical protein
MCDDGAQANPNQPLQVVADGRRNGIVAELEQQVTGFFDSVIIRFFRKAIQIFLGEIEITPQTQLRRRTDSHTQLVENAA